VTSVLLLIIITLGLGVCIGKWWEHDRPGGTGDLDLHIDRLEDELEAEQLDNTLLRGERDERRNASMAGHPSARAARRLYAVTETPA
jgi:hypothetical protein